MTSLQVDARQGDWHLRLQVAFSRRSGAHIDGRHHQGATRMRRARPLSVSLRTSVLIALAAACPALAQQAAPDPATDDLSGLEVIVVTGTRITRAESSFANPVVSISAEAIAQSGRTNVADFLAQSPALVGSLTGDLTAGSNSAFGEAGLELLNLRNLGVDRTLVLVDGRRHVAGVAGSAAVDIDAIPTDLIETVDVLTGGASAIYGADGVSGVVNFRLRQNFEGITARAQGGMSEQGDGDNRFIAFTAGTNFAADRGNVAFAYEYSSDDRVSDQDRRYLRNPQAANLYQNQDDLDDSPDLPDLVRYNDVRYADSARMGAVDVDFDLLSDLEGTGNVYDRGFVLEGSGGFAQGGSSTMVDGYQGDLFPEVDRNLVNVLTHFDVNDAFTVFAEAKYARTEASTLAQPTFDFYLFMTPDNPFMPQAIRDAIVPGAAATYFEDPATPDGVLVTRDNFDLGINTEQTTRETLRGVLGANGRLSEHLTYEVSYVYGETESRILSQGNRLEAEWLAAVDVVTDPATGRPVCRSSLDPDAPPELAGCIPYNIFGDGVRDPAAIGFVTTDSVSRSKVTQHVVSGSLSGDLGAYFSLPGGPVGFAIGAEYRREESEFRPDPLIRDGLTWAGAVEPQSGDFDVSEVFAEVNLPLLEDAPGAHLLSFGAAVRASDYSTIGMTNSWKVDAVYAPIRDISFRGTYSQAVRAPNIAELFAPPSSSFNFIIDPCDTTELNNGSASREANCAALLSALGVDPTTFSPSSTPQSSVFTEGLAGGNPDLSEETATTWTVGIVLQPASLPGLRLSADWYDIEIEDAINTPEAQDLAQLCVDQPSLDNPFCPGIARDPDTGYVVGFTVQPDNVASFRTAGLDLTASYSRSTDDYGVFSVQLVAGYLDRLEFIATPGAAPTSERGQIYSPEYVANFDATWTRGPLSIAYGINWFSETDRFSRETLAGDPDYAEARYLKVKEKWDHDLYVGFDVNDWLNVYAGVNNLFDQLPEFGYSSYPISAMGRYFYAGAKVSLGRTN
jgi:outer membrane receptor protein involved in Fe transport